MNFKTFLIESSIPGFSGLKLKRYKNLVGKPMMEFVYFHKNYIDMFPQWKDNIIQKASLLPHDFDYVAIKYNTKTDEVSFISSPDFDTSDEPIVGDSYKVDNNGNVKLTRRSSDPLIWHHKWQWVTDDYHGFDVNKSKERSVYWKNIMKEYPKEYISKIGRYSFWHNLDFNK